MASLTHIFMYIQKAHKLQYHYPFQYWLWLLQNSKFLKVRPYLRNRIYTDTLLFFKNLFRPAILDDELLVGTGMAAALKAASQMGYIEKNQTKAKSSGLQELVAKKFSIEDKSRYNFSSCADF